MTEQERYEWFVKQLSEIGVEVQKLHEFRYNLLIANTTGTGQTLDMALINFLQNLVKQNQDMQKELRVLRRYEKVASPIIANIK